MKTFEPCGYMRRWAFDGEIPEKTKNDNGRRSWPAKYKFLEVTKIQCLPDDVPLYAIDLDKLELYEQTLRDILVEAEFVAGDKAPFTTWIATKIRSVFKELYD